MQAGIVDTLWTFEDLYDAGVIRIADPPRTPDNLRIISGVFFFATRNQKDRIMRRSIVLLAVFGLAAMAFRATAENKAGSHQLKLTAIQSPDGPKVEASIGEFVLTASEMQLQIGDHERSTTMFATKDGRVHMRYSASEKATSVMSATSFYLGSNGSVKVINK